MVNEETILVENLKNGPCGRFRHRWEDDVKM
jgi:hypothetical protein